ncbi:hypothetical protein KEM60_01055 [Austwickia sp. TVS 96-490-7B]|uniref:DUF5692 family protein n=1 Tax=Austwickia sp. TVS 96-490-7B TaxID=2830843 RepID=UPI001C596B4C|nr:DUF5692 family protein [Austwickia sp. TVS 96-490-7B]MBW3084866.1 hypothetical protein [Austwickia sp. TVS 96-490-7B]
MTPDYPTLFFFERGEWWDYAMLIVVAACLAFAAWLIQRSKTAVVIIFVVIPLTMTIFWWPHSTDGTEVAGWFPVVKHYSALVGSFSLVGLQYIPSLRRKNWYLLLPALILAINILEAVVRELQCHSFNGVDPTQGMVTWGGPWNIMNAIAGVLNLLAISGWVGIFVAEGKSKAIIWGDLTIWWIIAYDLWNFSYIYNCLADRSWYSGLALLASCTVPVLFSFGRGAWIQYRAYTLTMWSAVALTVPHFTQDSMFAHRSAHNPTAMFLIALASLLANIGVMAWHVYRIVTLRRNPCTQEIYSDTPEYVALMRHIAPVEEQDRTAARIGRTAEDLGYRDAPPPTAAPEPTQEVPPRTPVPTG